MKKENKATENKRIRDIKNSFQHEKEEENYNKLVQVGNFWNNYYMEYKSSGNRNKKLSVEENVNKIKPSLNDIINHLKKIDKWKINFISFKGNDKEHVMH